MNIRMFYFTFLFLLSVTAILVSSDKKKSVSHYNAYFPVNNGNILIYKSSFGESSTIYFKDGEFIVSSSEGDNFKYRQTFIIREEGVYTKETYQYLKIFLFIKKESTVIYENPLLRFPLPLLPGARWQWEGYEYTEDEISKVKVSGEAFNKELVITKAGSFEAIKLETIIETADDAKNKVTEWYADGIGLIKAKILIEGGGVMGLLRDVLGYGNIEFELAEIRKQ